MIKKKFIDGAFGMWKGDKKTKSVRSYVRKIRKWDKQAEPIQTPSKRVKKYSLREMLKKITKDNVHPETDWDPPVGREIV